MKLSKTDMLSLLIITGIMGGMVYAALLLAYLGTL